MHSPNDILTRLRTVFAPNGGGSIVDAGMVSGITLRGSELGFILESDSAHATALESACRTALATLSGITQIRIITTAHATQATGETTAVPAKKAHYEKAPLPGVDRIIAIASGKGGVGKSSLTILLAHALAAQGRRVGIVDADIHGPSIPRMLGLAPTPPAIHDGLMVPAHAHGIMANSIGLIAGETAAIWRGPMVSKALGQLLRGTNWHANNAPDNQNERDRATAQRGEVNSGEAGRGGGTTFRSTPPVSEANTTLLIDLPPGTGDIQLSLMQSVPVDAAIIVTTPQEVARIDAHKAATMFQKLNIPILGIVENMSYLETPTGERLTPFGAGGGQTLADSVGVPLLAQLPLDPTLGAALDKGHTPDTHYQTLLASIVNTMTKPAL